MSDCRQELHEMWDGDTCPCENFDVDPDNLPRNGIVTISKETE